MKPMKRVPPYSKLVSAIIHQPYRKRGHLQACGGILVVNFTEIY